jgi:hypothetical protein
MVSYNTLIHRFEEKGEKTGWSYIEVPQDIAEQINPGVRVSYRVKGKLDDHPLKGVSLLPMGSGNFLIPFNEKLRKGTGKSVGAMVSVSLELDKPYELCHDLVECLADEAEAGEQFYKMPRSHQNYFSKWVEEAKTENTKARRIAQVIDAMYKRYDFGKMIRENRRSTDTL